MTFIFSDLNPRYKRIQKSTTSPRIRKTFFACCLLSVLALVIRYNTYYEWNDIYTQPPKRKPTCPIPDNIKACIHHSADLTSLAELCPNMTSPVIDCRDRTHDLIVTDKEFVGIFSNFTNKMVVPGSDIGEDLDRFVQKDSRWTIDVMDSAGYEVLTSTVDPERLTLQKELDLLQNKCERFFHGAMGIYGFGSNWHALGLGLAHTLYYKMTLYPFDEHKNFIGMTTCTEEQMQSAFAQNPPQTDMQLWDASTTNFKSLSPDVHSLMLQIGIINPELEHRGLFWWRSMLTYYATRPNFKMREVIRQTSTVITPCMSIHVRHSDKGAEAPLLDFPKYMEAASLYKSKTGISNIYLMTDDPKVLALTNSTEYKDFRFQYLGVPRTNKGWEADAKHGLSLDVQERNFIIDIYSAAQCQHNIVTYSSNVGRLIAEVAYAIQDKKPDVVSLDEPWKMYP
ncbi:hypothetical protein BGX26_005607 [Mortierella sp. AD094]|nr:hypothetical protein BGX26_005607 [Mortierella sp. AD094]